MAINGELKDLYNDLDKRLSIMEEMSSAWQKVHDSTAERRHSENKTTLGNIFDRLNSLPCDRRLSFYTHMKWQVATMWGVIALIIGIIIRHGVS